MHQKILSWPKITGDFNEYSLIFLALIAIFGATIYYAYALDWPAIIITIILSAATLFFFRPFKRQLASSRGLSNLKRAEKIWLAVYGLNLLALLAVLWSSRSDRALISPWQVVNYNFFWLYASASFFLIVILAKKRISANWKIALLSAHYFLSFSVALIVYKIGYGFDPFIHQATMELIAAKGQVLPKPPYYLGAYSLMVIINKLSGLSLHFLNQILVPGLSAFFLPPAIYHFLVQRSENQGKADDGNLYFESGPIFLTILFLLVLTFAPFTLTTPQNLSYLFLILTVLAGLNNGRLDRVFILAAATASIHPLTGLPALSWAVWLSFNKHRKKFSKKIQKITAAVIWLMTALALPASLFLSAGQSWKTGGNWLLSFFEPLKNLIANPGSAGREDWLLNSVYFLADNYQLLFILICAAALILFYRRARQNESSEEPALSGLIFINSGLITAYLLSSQIKFTDLISYEQTAYAERIPLIIAIFFLPLLAWLSLRLLGRLFRLSNPEMIIWLIFGLSLLTASLYLSYPRFDKYWNSRGYSTSAYDLAAVHAIDRDAPASYIVLANQQVSAAALQQFGFDHYYQTKLGPLYFYPIPTGGPLYQYYLDMVYKSPSQDNLAGACRLTGVKRAYLVVNKYWYQSGRTINEAKLAADHWWTINNEVYIFSYNCPD